MSKILNCLKNCFSKVWEYKLLYCERFMSCLAVLMTVYSLISICDSIDCFFTKYSIICIVAIIISCIVYALWRVFKKKSDLTIEINKRTKLHIKEGNLWESNNIKLIPVNEYFDTHVGDNIINEKSIHGQFLTKYQNEIADIKKQIGNQLAKIDDVPNGRKRDLVDGLPQKRYPLGTCIRVCINKQSFILLALTRFDVNEHVDVSAEEYPEIIRKMFNGIQELNNGNAVEMPFVGRGISGFDLTPMQMLNIIVQQALMADKLQITHDITLWLYGEDVNDVDLDVIEYLSKRWKMLK